MQVWYSSMRLCELFTPCWLHQRDIFMCNINLWQGIWYCRVYGRIFAAFAWVCSTTIALPRCEHAICQCRFLPGNARYLLGFGCWSWSRLRSLLDLWSRGRDSLVLAKAGLVRSCHSGIVRLQQLEGDSELVPECCMLCMLEPVYYW